MFSAACIDLGLIPLLLDTVSTSFTSVDKMSPTDCLIQDVCHFSFCFLTCSLARKEIVLLMLTGRVYVNRSAVFLSVRRNNQCSWLTCLFFSRHIYTGLPNVCGLRDRSQLLYNMTYLYSLILYLKAKVSQPFNICVFFSMAHVRIFI